MSCDNVKIDNVVTEKRFFILFPHFFLSFLLFSKVIFFGSSWSPCGFVERLVERFS